jgi:preprotein translocase subunit Sss1
VKWRGEMTKDSLKKMQYTELIALTNKPTDKEFFEMSDN